MAAALSASLSSTTLPAQGRTLSGWLAAVAWAAYPHVDRIRQTEQVLCGNEGVGDYKLYQVTAISDAISELSYHHDGPIQIDLYIRFSLYIRNNRAAF
jgi:hypothetical protein